MSPQDAEKNREYGLMFILIGLVPGLLLALGLAGVPLLGFEKEPKDSLITVMAVCLLVGSIGVVLMASSLLAGGNRRNGDAHS